MSEIVELNSLMSEGEILCFREFFYELERGESRHLLRNDIVLKFEEFLRRRKEVNGLDMEVARLKAFLLQCQEALLTGESAVLLHRARVAKYGFYQIRYGEDVIEQLSSGEFLDLRETLSEKTRLPVEKKLTIDFQPFYSFGPIIRDHRKIGSGQRFLNSFMAGKLQNEPERWHTHLYEFLKIHSIHNEKLLIDGEVIRNPNDLFEVLQQALEILDGRLEDQDAGEIRKKLAGLGIRDGFGNTPARLRNNVQLLSNLFEEPNSDYLEEFISTIPMVSRVAIISPHGWFGQDHVLGRPDTGGQVVYILDQVKALERFLTESLAQAGLDIQPKIIVLTRLIPDNEGTTSDQRLEKIYGTANSWILRVPLRDENQNVIPQWISRFQLWPYLEQFALDGKNELLTELGGKPDLIVGNYSDGNLVASLLSSWLGVIQCNIAHALEKSKYLFSDLCWQDMEKNYNFSLQFTADLIAMNQSDIIISSTAQEIAGTETVMGQYESYYMFSMPELYKVTHGVNLFHPKFNVVSPGVDESLYFPHKEKERRLANQVRELSDRLFTDQGPDIFGELEYPELTPIFTMARLDKIKNLTGLVDSFGQCPELQDRANLIVVTRSIREEGIVDAEERVELEKMYQLIEKHRLQGKIRWLENSSRQTGAEMYRIIADRKGVFVQPALFEAFGLTVLEGMATGLPVFATQFGGPLEIIQDGVNGFLINPTQPERVSGPILNFLRRCESDRNLWETISLQAIGRVQSAYTWKLYSEKLIRFAKLYGFWNFSALRDEKNEINQYCNLLFHLIFKKRAEELRERLDGGK